MVKACTLAYWSLSCSVKNAAEVALCISQGMAVLGPAITLDTLVETLVIGVGTLSGELPKCYLLMLNFLIFIVCFDYIYNRGSQARSIVRLRMHVSRRQLCSVHDILSSLFGPGVRG